MQGRRCPTVILACLAAIWTGGLTGCATAPESGSVPIPPAGRSEAKVSFEIQSSGRGSATIFVNGEERGDTPVYIRADADVTGHTAEDLVIKAVWEGGGNETEFTIPRGSKPQPIVRLGPSGEREF